MDRILLVVAIVFLYSSSSLATDQDRASGELQYTLVSYHENGFDGVKQTAWVGEYGQLTNEIVTIEEKSVDDWFDRRSSTLGTGIGVGVTPLFDTYSVFRTSSNNDKPTYFVLGFISDELTMDEAGAQDGGNDSVFSYGFGVNRSTSSNFEYMMSLGQENYQISAIGISFISEF